VSHRGASLGMPNEAVIAWGRKRTGETCSLDGCFVLKATVLPVSRQSSKVGVSHYGEAIWITVAAQPHHPCHHISTRLLRRHEYADP
jgi:hypothetical protein